MSLNKWKWHTCNNSATLWQVLHNNRSNTMFVLITQYLYLQTLKTRSNPQQAKQVCYFCCKCWDINCATDTCGEIQVKFICLRGPIALSLDQFGPNAQPTCKQRPYPPWWKLWDENSLNSRPIWDNTEVGALLVGRTKLGESGPPVGTPGPCCDMWRLGTHMTQV